jgi:hypothetical protein
MKSLLINIILEILLNNVFTFIISNKTDLLDYKFKIMNVISKCVYRHLWTTMEIHYIIYKAIFGSIIYKYYVPLGIK